MVAIDVTIRHGRGTPVIGAAVVAPSFSLNTAAPPLLDGPRWSACRNSRRRCCRRVLTRTIICAARRMSVNGVRQGAENFFEPGRQEGEGLPQGDEVAYSAAVS